MCNKTKNEKKKKKKENTFPDIAYNVLLVKEF